MFLSDRNASKQLCPGFPALNMQCKMESDGYWMACLISKFG